MELLFPLEDSMVVALPIVLLGLWKFVFFVFVLFLSFFDRKVLFETFGGVTLLWFMLLAEGWLDFHLHFYVLKPDLRSFVGFCETRVPQSRSSSSSGLAIACIGCAGHQ